MKNKKESKLSEKNYRQDLNLWEERIKLFWFIHYYRYSIWKDGKLRVKYSLRIKNSKTKKYLGLIKLPPAEIPAKEFDHYLKTKEWKNDTKT